MEARHQTGRLSQSLWNLTLEIRSILQSVLKVQSKYRDGMLCKCKTITEDFIYTVRV